jgi:hypothetical protein
VVVNNDYVYLFHNCIYDKKVKKGTSKNSILIFQKDEVR